MATLAGRLRKALFGIAYSKTDFDVLGFPPSPSDKRTHLQNVARNFVDGYNAALLSADFDDLHNRLEAISASHRGFAYEGAAMALEIFDIMTPWKRNRTLLYIQTIAQKHIYMSYVGAGWAYAQLGMKPNVNKPGYHPLWRWLMVDGYGFHQGFFHNKKFFEQQQRHPKIGGYAANAFDQGLGRVAWFVYGTDVDKLASVFNSFEASRRGDLWGGLGLACAYAGGVPEETLVRLKSLSGEYAGHLAQGVSFAATARYVAQNPVPHTEMACRVICDRSLEETARIALSAAEEKYPETESTPAFENMRQSLIRQFSSVGVYA